jgi:hypothetical protein
VVQVDGEELVPGLEREQVGVGGLDGGWEELGAAAGDAAVLGVYGCEVLKLGV